MNPGVIKNLVTGEEYLLDDTRPNEDLEFSPDGRTIATIPGESLWLSDTSTGRARAEFLSFSDGSWIVRTPEGFFNASEGGAKHLILVRGLDTLSIDQVHDALYRPDLVREALAGDPDGKVAAAAAHLDLAKVAASGMPPRIVALISLDGDSVAGDAVEVSADIEVRSGGVGRVEWRVNGIVQGAESPRAEPARGAVPGRRRGCRSGCSSCRARTPFRWPCTTKPTSSPPTPWKSSSPAPGRRCPDRSCTCWRRG